MRRILQLALLFGWALMVGSAAAQTQVNFTWTSGNTGSTALPACPSSAPKACVSGYRLSMDGTQIAGETAIGPLETSYSQTPLPAPGSHSYSLIMVGFDALGNAIQSGAATATVTVPAVVTIPAPTGFNVQLK